MCVFLHVCDALHITYQQVFRSRKITKQFCNKINNFCYPPNEAVQNVRRLSYTLTQNSSLATITSVHNFVLHLQCSSVSAAQPDTAPETRGYSVHNLCY
jgi:hypothetical protein